MVLCVQYAERFMANKKKKNGNPKGFSFFSVKHNNKKDKREIIILLLCCMPSFFIGLSRKYEGFLCFL